MLQKDRTTLSNYTEATALEWLETNGLGGWSSSSVIGCNTRRYHGLLVAATVPPTERMALVSKLDETIVYNDQRYELGSNNYGDTVHPQGYQYLAHFSKDLFPEWHYEAGGIVLKKTIAMINGENTVVVLYTVINAPGAFTLELLPLLAVRGYHNLMHANEAIQQLGSFNNAVFHTKAYEGTPELFIKIPGSAYHPDPKWFYHVNTAAQHSAIADNLSTFTRA